MYLNKKFGIYIHWPFCLSKCPYCDFSSIIDKSFDENILVEAFLVELNYYHQHTKNEVVTSIFFGGGTPSLLNPKNIEKIINHITKKWTISDNVEISLEANPNSYKKDLFKNIASAGVNRLSLGVQALNNKDLKFLGRTHNLDDAFQSIEEIKTHFNNQSIDLIYTRPNQNIKDWEKELKLATSFNVKHISLYQLTIEEETAFYKLYNEGKFTLPNEDESQELFEFTKNYLSDFGYDKYEISNFAKSGFESKHNLIYWQGFNYLGIGPASHGRLNIDNKIIASENPKNITEYLKNISEFKHCILNPTQADDRAIELILMGFRLKNGIDKTIFKSIIGKDLENYLDSNKLKQFIDEGLVENSAKKIRATNKGMLLLNYIIEEIIY